MSLVENINDFVGLDHPNLLRVWTMTSYLESVSNSLNKWDWTWYSFFELDDGDMWRESFDIPPCLRFEDVLEEEDELPHKVKLSRLFDEEDEDCPLNLFNINQLIKVYWLIILLISCNNSMEQILIFYTLVCNRPSLMRFVAGVTALAISCSTNHSCGSRYGTWLDGPKHKRRW